MRVCSSSSRIGVAGPVFVFLRDNTGTGEARESMRFGKLRIAILLVLCFMAIALGVRYRQRKSSTTVVPHASPRIRIGMEYALLPASEAIANAKLLSGTSKAQVQSWEPTVADIEGLESNLSQVSSLVEGGPGPARHINDPHRYLRQYIAIEQGGKQRIYVNAFCASQGSDPNEWRKHLVLALDGGTCFWHALYDPTTQKFSDLRVNGVG